VEYPGSQGIHIPFVKIVSSYYKASFLGSLFTHNWRGCLPDHEIAKQARSRMMTSSVVVERLIGLLRPDLGIIGLSCLCW
jgi:hypothetical protein